MTIATTMATSEPITSVSIADKARNLRIINTVTISTITIATNTDTTGATTIINTVTGANVSESEVINTN